jgi:hypothetical protein
MMTHPFQIWLERHLEEATAEYNRIQALEDETEDDRELYERVHQMWGYLAGLEKCLKEFIRFELLNSKDLPPK